MQSYLARIAARHGTACIWLLQLLLDGIRDSLIV
jgi:hypothetical protein